MELGGLLTLIIVGVVLAVAAYIVSAILTGLNTPPWGHKVAYGVFLLLFVLAAARFLFGVNLGIG